MIILNEVNSRVMVLKTVFSEYQDPLVIGLL